MYSNWVGHFMQVSQLKEDLKKQGQSFTSTVNEKDEVCRHTVCVQRGNCT